MGYKVPELIEGEQLLWTAQPEEYKDYAASDRILLPVSGVLLAVSTLLAVYTGYSVYCYGFKAYHAVSLVIWLILAVFAVYTFFFRYMVKRSAKRRLVYGFTSAGRVMIRDMKTLDIYDYIGEDVEDAYISETDKDGVGTIYLGGKKRLFDNCGMRFLAGADSDYRALYDVQNAEQVLDMITGNGGMTL